MSIAKVVKDDNYLDKELCPMLNHHCMCNKVKVFPYHAEKSTTPKSHKLFSPIVCSLARYNNGNANGDANGRTASKSVTNCTDLETIVLPLLWVGINEEQEAAKY